MAAPDADETPGLRERKRIATRRAIAIAAVEVVRDRGLDAATIDEIARVADVSPRTFFNYFPSKEEALIGDLPALPDDAAQAAFLADRGPILAGIGRLFEAVAVPALADQELILLRRSITKQYPALSARRWAAMHQFEHDITDLVARRLAAEDPALAQDRRELHSHARMLAFIAVSTMRHAWLEWMDDNGDRGDLITQLDASFALLPKVLTQQNVLR
jgi:AcrR family transcriptional regulator